MFKSGTDLLNDYSDNVKGFSKPIRIIMRQGLYDQYKNSLPEGIAVRYKNAEVVAGDVSKWEFICGVDDE